MHQVFQSAWLFTPVIPYPLFLGLFVLALACFGFGVVSRLSVWRLGASEEDSGISRRSLAGILSLSVTKFFSPDCFLARRLFARSSWRGVALLFVLWGVLLTGVAVIFSFATFVFPGMPLPGQGLRMAGFSADVGGGFLLLGLVAALARRYLWQPRFVVPVPADGRLLWLMALTLFAGFLAKGERFSYAPLEGFLWHPVGSLFGAALQPLLAPAEAAFPFLYQASYSIHALLAMLLIAYLPYSKLVHMFAAQITTYAASMRRRGARFGYQSSGKATADLLLHGRT